MRGQYQATVPLQRGKSLQPTCGGSNAHDREAVRFRSWSAQMLSSHFPFLTVPRSPVMLYFFANELPPWVVGAFPFARILPSPLNGFLFRHPLPPNKYFEGAGIRR
jgi:hypothetical protein